MIVLYSHVMFTFKQLGPFIINLAVGSGVYVTGHEKIGLMCTQNLTTLITLLINIVI